MTLSLHDDHDGLQAQMKLGMGSFEKRRQHRHELRILTCFIDFDAVRGLVAAIAQEVRLTDVRLIFDYSEIYRQRTPDQAIAGLSSIEGRCHELGASFTWNAVKAGALMHAKAFAVVQHKGGAVHDGRIWVTSGNATARGLGQRTPNFELSLTTDRRRDLKSFLTIWEDLENRYSVDIGRPVRKAEDYGFKYGLLASGTFLHRWATPLAAQLALRYPMTERGRRDAVTVADLIKDQGFELGVGSLSRQPLAFKARKVLPRSFSRDYTVDTLLGRWCPHCVWSVVSASVSGNAAFQAFRASFRRQTTSESLDRIVADEAVREGALVARGFVEADEDRLGRWRERTATLRDDEARLERIFLDYQDFELPYAYEAKSDVEEVFRSLSDSMEMARRESVTVKLARSAITKADLRALALGDDEREALSRILRQGSGHPGSTAA
ncbi:hypothetical protein [Beijerinckia sp. L45]|uniref:hypothetical protein n=1 Tax=Beijerinckia sp. L45 TaxID=1641855 RepID=UPI00131B5B2A|nr:hypothetical protein [Beijerinckia sp. L45]